MKTFTYAAAIERGVLAENARWDGTLAGTYIHDGHEVRDVSAHGIMSTDDVLAFSSNVGSLQIFERVGAQAMVDELGALHFGDALDLGVSPAGAPLRTSAGMPSHADLARESAVDIGLASVGALLSVSPVALAAAFRAVTVDGLYRSPHFFAQESEPSGKRVVRPETVALLRTYLESSVSRDDGTGHLAQVAAAPASRGRRAPGRPPTIRAATRTSSGWSRPRLRASSSSSGW